MEITERIINNIIMKVQNYVDSAENLNKIKNVICSELYNYNISEKSYEVSTEVNVDNKYYLDLFIASKRVQGIKETSLRKYTFDIEKLFDYIDKPVTKITANDIRFFLAKYKGTNTNTTMDNMRRSYSSFFNWLEAEDYITKSPTRKISKIKNDTIKEKPYTSAEMEAMLISSKNDKNKAMLTMMYSTAIRVTELSKVRLEDINMQTKTLHIINGKGGKDRYVPLEDKTLFYLDKYLSDKKLFKNKETLFDLKAASIRSIVKNIGNQANVIHAHPHRYRVTRITDLLRRGMKLEEVQLIAGHTDINTTASYNRCDLSLVDAEFRRKS